MKTKNLLLVATLIIGTMTFTSCQKKGCTDADASNFDSKAKKDDGSCQFKTGVVFWYNQATADSLIAYGCSSLTFYVNGAVIGSSAASVYFASDPSCGSGSAHASYSLGNVKTKSYSYYVSMDFPTGSYAGGDTVISNLWSGTINLNAHNSCLSQQLAW